MNKLWRPADWEKRYTEEWYAARSINHNNFEWRMWDCETAYENGADAMLEVLKKMSTNAGDVLRDTSKHFTVVFIPD